MSANRIWAGVVTHAADLLDAEARALLQCQTPGGNGDWSGEAAAKADHDDMKTTAQNLREFARQLNQMEVKHGHTHRPK